MARKMQNPSKTAFICPTMRFNSADGKSVPPKIFNALKRKKMAKKKEIITFGCKKDAQYVVDNQELYADEVVYSAIDYLTK